MWRDTQTISAKQDEHSNLREALEHVRAMCTAQMGRLSRMKASPSVARSGSVLSTSTTPGTSTFNVVCERRWNQEMQSIVDDPKKDALEKIATVNNLLREFSDVMTSHFSTFIERYLSENPEDADLIQWAQPSDVALGSCITITMLDNPGAAPKEYKQQLAFLSQQLLLFPSSPYVHVFPKSMVHVRGRLALISAELPALGEILDSKSCSEFRFALDGAGATLNLSPYRKALDDGVEENAVGPVSGTVRKCVDGRLYVDSFPDWFPIFPPSRGAAASPDHTLFHRVEYFAAAPVSLSPGTFKVFGSRDSAVHSKNLRQLSASLAQDVLPNIGGELMLTPPKSGAELVSTLHSHGIPLGLLPVLYVHVSQSPENKLGSLVLAEMTARAARCVVRETMLSRIDESDMHVEIQTMCAGVCDKERIQETWEEQLYPALKLKYAGFASLMPNTQECIASLDTSIWLKRFAELMGVKFAAGVTNEGTSEFHFTIDQVSPVVKTFQLPEPRIGKLKFQRHGESPSGVFNPAANNLTPTRFMIPVQKVLAENGAKDCTDAISEYVSHFQRGKGVKSVDYGIALTEAARLLSRRGDDEKACIFYEKSLEVLRALPNCDRETRLLGRAYFLRGLASLRLGVFRDAVKGITQGVKYMEEVQSIEQIHEKSNTTSLNNTQTITTDAAETKPVLYPLETMLALEQLAGLYESKGLLEEAEPLYRKVLVCTKTMCGVEQKSVSTALNNLACNLFAQESFLEAEQLYLEDIALTEKICEPNSLELATSLNNLAAVYDAQSRSEDALPLYQRDLEITLAALGVDHENVATSRNNLATCLLKLGRLEEAEKEYKASLELRKRQSTNSGPAIADVLTNIGALKLGQGKPVEAKTTFLEALELYENSLGKNHHQLKRCLDHLCNLCEAMGADEEAELYSDRLMDLKRADNDIYTAQQAAATSPGK